MMQEVQLKLTAEEVAFIVAVLGNLPTQSNAWPLMQKVKSQAGPESSKESIQESIQ